MRSRAWTPERRRWEIAPVFAEASEWARKIGTGPLVVQVLANRGIKTAEEGKRFLNPKLTDLHDPSLLKGSAEAARRIAKAAGSGERIVLYGDYDVDGITAIAILHGCLKMLGCESDFYVPHRQEEGYGVNAPAVRKIVESGAKLIVTVDCGISDGAALAEAARAGVDVIVTDHHGLPEKLPEGATIVHPAMGGYPNPDLCGAGVAFKLAWAVAREIGGETKVSEPLREFLVDATCLAALGTIADVVPLVGENRILAWYGLKGLSSTKHVGMRSLLGSAGLGEKAIEADDVGFVLGPRLNASGRMGHARQAVELLLGTDPGRCRQIADHLSRLNEQRQEVERQILEEALAIIGAGESKSESASEGSEKGRKRENASEMGVGGKLGEKKRENAREGNVIVLSSERWHSGVIGIVAGRLAERFHRPAVLIAISADGTATGSCRSIPGFDMRLALAACAEHLEGFGGHTMAGGLRIAQEKIVAFAEAMQHHAKGAIAPAQLTPSIQIDARATLAAMGYSTVEHLSRLAPFGQGNPPPVIEIDGCKVLTEARRMGRNGKTISFHVGQGESSMRAVGFGMAELADRLAVGTRVNLAAEPTINRFNGSASVELRLVDVAFQ